MRDRGHKLGEIGEHGTLIRRQHQLLLLWHDIGADRGQRRRVLHLEPATRGDDALLAQPDKRLVRLKVDGGIPEVRPGQAFGVDAGRQPDQGCLVRLRVRLRANDLEVRVTGEPLQLEEDPVAAVLTGSPSGNLRTPAGIRAAISRITVSVSARLTLPLK